MTSHLGVGGLRGRKADLLLYRLKVVGQGLSRERVRRSGRAREAPPEGVAGLSVAARVDRAARGVRAKRAPGQASVLQTEPFTVNHCQCLGK